MAFVLFSSWLAWAFLWRAGSSGTPDDPFASSTFSLVLSWISFSAIPSAVLSGIFAFYTYSQGKGAHWLFSTWVLFCLLVFSPFIYILFQTTLALSFPFQSIPAFLASACLMLYVPIILIILFLIGVYLPYYLSFWLLGTKMPIRRLRYLLASIATPIAAIVGATLFWIVLPIAAFSVHWLRPGEVIKATNGPARYVGAISLWLPQPDYASRTPRTMRDYVRCHVAYVYLRGYP